MTDHGNAALAAEHPEPRREGPERAETANERQAFLRDVLEGLSRPQKELPCKWLYDARGSALFERICDLPEYYPTRTELSILERHIGAMAPQLGSGCAVIEYGSGSGLKTQLLLEHVRHAACYVPVDISASALADATARLQRRFPALTIAPVRGDFMHPITLPPEARRAQRRAVFFPGSTIGNLHRDETVVFLSRARRDCGRGGGLLLGIDLLKDRATLLRAYDDPRGVTAAFDQNLLVRANAELGADFDVDSFRHEARFDERLGRVEMHLVARRDHDVHVGGVTFRFEAGESIHTESSYKYALTELRALAALAGWRCEQVWTDEQAWFAVCWLVTA
ncbi:MAG TPA: L-histidine N(alpha)-methyltransferase [Anaeromyxobacteraceae bacterium]|nr:L-histidine N(alpha)-methyltransferase [Anaeromyxobacteraceae bacterium]